MSDGIKEKLLLYKVSVKKDPDAYAALYDVYVKRIYRFVYFKVGSHEQAEDITSEVFLKAWQYLINKSEEERAVNSFGGLLYKIARNNVIDFYRKNTAKHEINLTEEFEIGDEGRWSVGVGEKIEVERIIQAIKKLKQEYQEIVTLRFVDELEIGEIAEITNKGQIAVRVTLHRALKKLKEILEK